MPNNRRKRKRRNSRKLIDKNEKPEFAGFSYMVGAHPHLLYLMVIPVCLLLFFFFICLLFIFELQVIFVVREMRGEQKIDTFKYLYETHASSLIRFAKRFTSARVAEDLVQDIFLEIWKNDKDLNHDYSRSYLYTAVQNRCINFLKQEQHKKIYIHDTQAEERVINFSDNVHSNDNTEQMQRIYHQIDLLPDKCRQIFKLAYVEEKKSTEIAELLKLSIRTVEHQLYLGLKSLRDNLSKPQK